MNPGPGRAWRNLAALGLCLAAGGAPVSAADYPDAPRGAYGRADGPDPSALAPLPRYFPREGDDGAPPHLARPVRRVTGCVPRRVPIPTDLPNDPSYVGSAYGLGKPSYYGFTPPLGVDDPYGRSLLPYCP